MNELIFPGGSEVKASACNAGDPALIPGLGRSPGEGNGNPPQYSCLGNPMDREALWVTVHGVPKSWLKSNSSSFYAVVQSVIPTLWDPMDCSTPGFPVLHHLPELVQTRPLNRWSHPTVSSSVIPFPPIFNLSQHLMSQLFTSGDQSSFYNNIIFCREENLNVMKPSLSVISFMSCAFGIVFKLHLGLPSILSQVLWVV